MATVTIPNTSTNGLASSATAINANFAALVNFLNASILQRDGSKAMLADLDTGGNKITGVATAAATTDGIPKSYIDTFNVAGVWTRSTSVASASGGAVVSFDAEVSDPLGIGNLGTSATDFTVTTDGMYMVMVEYYSINSNGSFLTMRHTRDGYSTAPWKGAGAAEVTSWIDSSSGSNHYYSQSIDYMFLSTGDIISVWTGDVAGYDAYAPRLVILKMAD